MYIWRADAWRLTENEKIFEEFLPRTNTNIGVRISHKDHKEEGRSFLSESLA